MVSSGNDDEAGQVFLLLTKNWHVPLLAVGTQMASQPVMSLLITRKRQLLEKLVGAWKYVWPSMGKWRSD